MATLLNFTKESITKIETPKSGAVTYRDTKERGLILIAGYGGTKVFYGEFVFPSIRSKSGHLKNQMKTWNKVLKKAKLEDLCLHDLRRTFASWLRQEGADTKIIGKALNNFTAVDVYAYLDNRNVKTAIDRTFDNRINGNLTNCTQEQKEKLIS